MSQNADIGICGFCGDECNPCSQSCGRCSRAFTGFSLGWNTLPTHLQHLHPEFYTDIKLKEKISSINKDEPKEIRRSKRNRKNNK